MKGFYTDVRLGDHIVATTPIGQHDKGEKSGMWGRVVYFNRGKREFLVQFKDFSYGHNGYGKGNLENSNENDCWFYGEHIYNRYNSQDEYEVVRKVRATVIV